MKLDNNYKKSREYYYPQNLGIGAIGMLLFCVFAVAGAFGMMDRVFVFSIYVICFMTATSLYFWPLIQVRENNIEVSIIKKFRNIPINRSLFVKRN